MTPAPTDPRPVQTSHSVLSVSRVLHLNESKARRSSGNPDVPHRSVLGEGVLQVIPVSVVSETTNVDLTVDIPIPVSHF